VSAVDDLRAEIRRAMLRLRREIVSADRRLAEMAKDDHAATARAERALRESAYSVTRAGDEWAVVRDADQKLLGHERYPTYQLARRSVIEMAGSNLRGAA